MFTRLSILVLKYLVPALYGLLIFSLLEEARDWIDLTVGILIGFITPVFDRVRNDSLDLLVDRKRRKK